MRSSQSAIKFNFKEEIPTRSGNLSKIWHHLLFQEEAISLCGSTAVKMAKEIDISFNTAGWEQANVINFANIKKLLQQKFI